MKRIHFLGFTLLSFLTFAFPALTHAKVYCTVNNGSSYAPKYQDIDQNSDLCRAMNYLVARGVMSQFGTAGTADGYMLAGDYTNRAQSVAVVLNAFDPQSNVVTSYNDQPTGAQLGFKDTPAYDRQWWYSYALRGIQLGFIRGYDDGNFRGGNNVSRAEFVKMFLAASPQRNDVNAFDADHYRYLFDDLQNHSDQWYARYVEYAGYYGDMRRAFLARCPANNFCPSLSMTTNEMALFMYYYHLWTGKDIGFKGGVNPSPTPTPTPTPNITAPVLVSPTNGLQYSGSNPSINFTWNAVPGAVNYDFMIKVGGSSQFASYRTVNNSYFFPASQFPPLVQNYGNSWKVRAYDGFGNYRDSAEWFFTIFKTNTLTAPTLTSPLTGTVYDTSNSNLSINFQWTNTGASSYHFKMRLLSSSGYFVDQIVNTNSYTYLFTGLNATSYDGLQYNWTVDAYDSNGNKLTATNGEYTFRFKTSSALNAPVLAYPGAGVTISKSACLANEVVQFGWHGVSGAVNYALYVNDGSGVIKSFPTAGLTYDWSTKNWNPPQSKNPITWWVRAFDGQGNYKDSDSRGFNFVLVQCAV